MTRRAFALGGMKFEVITAVGAPTVWVFRVDLYPRVMVAAGVPEALTLTDAYGSWDVAVLEQAVIGSLEDAAA